MTHSVAALTLAVHGAKGGVGASLLASQLALDASAGARTALVDLDATGGACSALLGLEERGSMLSLLGRGVSKAEVTAVARRHPSGLAVLAAEPFEVASGLLDAAAVGRLLGLVRACFDVVIVDVPARLDDRGAAALAAADQTLLVVTPEVPCVVAARRAVDALAWRDFPLGRVGVVVNMLEGSEGVTPEQIASALALRLTGTIPFDPKPVRQAINNAREQGGFLGPGRARSAVAALCAQVLTESEVETLGGGNARSAEAGSEGLHSGSRTLAGTGGQERGDVGPGGGDAGTGPYGELGLRVGNAACGEDTIGTAGQSAGDPVPGGGEAGAGSKGDPPQAPAVPGAGTASWEDAPTGDAGNGRHGTRSQGTDAGRKPDPGDHETLPSGVAHPTIAPAPMPFLTAEPPADGGWNDGTCGNASGGSSSGLDHGADRNGCGGHDTAVHHTENPDRLGHPSNALDASRHGGPEQGVEGDDAGSWTADGGWSDATAVQPDTRGRPSNTPDATRHSGSEQGVEGEGAGSWTVEGLLGWGGAPTQDARGVDPGDGEP